MAYTLKQAAEAVGKSKPTILRAIQSHKISATRDQVTQGWLIEPAELHRVYPPIANEPVRNGQMTHGVTDGETVSIRELQAKLDAAAERLADKDTVIDDLRHRLDQEGEERRQAQARLTALLTDQRAKRSRDGAVGGRSESDSVRGMARGSTWCKIPKGALRHYSGNAVRDSGGSNGSEIANSRGITSRPLVSVQSKLGADKPRRARRPRFGLNASHAR